MIPVSKKKKRRRAGSGTVNQSEKWPNAVSIIGPPLEEDDETRLSFTSSYQCMSPLSSVDVYDDDTCQSLSRDEDLIHSTHNTVDVTDLDKLKLDVKDPSCTLSAAFDPSFTDILDDDDGTFKQKYPILKQGKRKAKGSRAFTGIGKRKNILDTSILSIQFPSHLNIGGVSEQPVALAIHEEPENNHRARYHTEGSRGAVKNESQSGFPAVKLSGYNKPVELMVFIGCGEGKIKPHKYYQASKVCGKQSRPCTEDTIDTTCVLKIPFNPAEEPVVSIDCVGILKLRKCDVEQRFGPAFVNNSSGKQNNKRSSKSAAQCKDSKARLVFRVTIPGPDGNEYILQVASSPILCIQSRGAPEVVRYSMKSCAVTGGEDLFIIGRNFQKDSQLRVLFREMQQVDFSGKPKQAWQDDATIDMEVFHEMHIVCTVPAYKHIDVSHVVPVEFLIITSQGASDAQPFVYEPAKTNASLNIPLIINNHKPLPAGVSPVAVQLNKAYTALKTKSHNVDVSQPSINLLNSPMTANLPKALSEQFRKVPSNNSNKQQNPFITIPCAFKPNIPGGGEDVQYVLLKPVGISTGLPGQATIFNSLKVDPSNIATQKDENGVLQEHTVLQNTINHESNAEEENDGQFIPAGVNSEVQSQTPSTVEYHQESASETPSIPARYTLPPQDFNIETAQPSFQNTSSEESKTLITNDSIMSGSHGEDKIDRTNTDYCSSTMEALTGNSFANQQPGMSQMPPMTYVPLQSTNTTSVSDPVVIPAVETNISNPVPIPMDYQAGTPRGTLNTVEYPVPMETHTASPKIVYVQPDVNYEMEGSSATLIDSAKYVDPQQNLLQNHADPYPTGLHVAPVNPPVMETGQQNGQYHLNKHTDGELKNENGVSFFGTNVEEPVVTLLCNNSTSDVVCSMDSNTADVQNASTQNKSYPVPMDTHNTVTLDTKAPCQPVAGIPVVLPVQQFNKGPSFSVSNDNNLPQQHVGLQQAPPTGGEMLIPGATGSCTEEYRGTTTAHYPRDTSNEIHTTVPVVTNNQLLHNTLSLENKPSYQQPTQQQFIDYAKELEMEHVSKYEKGIGCTEKKGEFEQIQDKLEDLASMYARQDCESDPRIVANLVKNEIGDTAGSIHQYNVKSPIPEDGFKQVYQNTQHSQPQTDVLLSESVAQASNNDTIVHNDNVHTDLHMGYQNMFEITDNHQGQDNQSHKQDEDPKSPTAESTAEAVQQANQLLNMSAEDVIHELKSLF